MVVEGGLVEVLFRVEMFGHSGMLKEESVPPLRIKGGRGDGGEGDGRGLGG